MKSKRNMIAIVICASLITLIAFSWIYGYINISSPTDQSKMNLIDDNNGFKTSRAPGPLEQDLRAKPFDESFRELIRRAEDSVSKQDDQNIFNFFNETEFMKVYTSDNLDITELTVTINDTGIFRNIEGSGQMVISGLRYKCVERVDLINSDVLLLNCKVVK